MSMYREPEKGSEHKDYAQNLRFSEDVISKMKGKIPEGLRVKIMGSDHLEKSVVMISYQDPDNKSIGSFAYPVCLHQSHQEFKTSLTHWFGIYEDFAKKNLPKQTEIDFNVL